MKRNAKAKLIDSEHKLLSIKELMEILIREAEGVPLEVKNSIIQTRDVSWREFIKEQEKTMNL